MTYTFPITQAPNPHLRVTAPRPATRTAPAMPSTTARPSGEEDHLLTPFFSFHACTSRL